jgi:hypothetical protein
MSGRAKAEVPDTIANPDWSGLLESALESESGSLSHYRTMYNYSLGNIAFLLYQGVTPQPVANFQRWKEVNRHVKRGASAYYILRPITVKTDQLDPKTGEPKMIQRFKPIKSVFPISMTEGEPLPDLELPEWSRDRMLGNLGLTLAADFPTYDGNTQGLSQGKTIYINPAAKHPEKTFFHETAHCQIGHTEDNYEEYLKHRGSYEAEAEGTAHIVGNELGVLSQEALADSGAYLRNWLRGEKIADRSVRRIFKAGDEILQAGRNDEKIETQSNNPAVQAGS